MTASLILVEGMTGAGKSTTAQRLWLHLERQGHLARWFYEHDTAHPVWKPGEQAAIAQAGACSPELLADVLPGRWRDLAAAGATSGQVTILDGALLQSTAGFLVAMDVPEAAVLDCLGRIEAAVARSAALVWFCPGSVEAQLQRVFAERSADGYEAALIALVGGTPYGRRTGLADAAGLVRFYRHWLDLVEAAFARWPSAKLALEAALDGEDWTARERRLTAFLGLPPMQDVPARIRRPERFTGRYRSAESGDELVVAGDQRGLFLDDGRRTQLLPGRGNAFHVAATCAEFRFRGASGGRFGRFEARGNLPGLSRAWIRTGEEAQ